MNQFPWNEKVVISRFWDHNACNGNGDEISKEGTLKSFLDNPSGQKFEDILGNAAKAITMLMSQVERLVEEKEALKEDVRRLKSRDRVED